MTQQSPCRGSDPTLGMLPLFSARASQRPHQHRCPCLGDSETGWNALVSGTTICSPSWCPLFSSDEDGGLGVSIRRDNSTDGVDGEHQAKGGTKDDPSVLGSNWPDWVKLTELGSTRGE